MNRYTGEPYRRSSRLLMTLLLVGCLSLLHGAAFAQAPWKQGKDMRRAVRRVVDFGNNVVKAKAADKVNLGFLDFGPFSGAYLKNKQSIHEGFLLEPKVQYFFLCAFDDQATDFSFSVTRESDGQEVPYTGTNVRAITPKKRVASVIFTPTKRERYRVTIGLKGSTTGGSCVGLAVLHKGGVRVPVETLYTVTDHCLDICENFTAKLAESKFVSNFYTGDNVWAVIGAFVKPGFRVMSDPKPYKSGVLTVVGAGQKTIGNVNLFILGDKADGDGNFPVISPETKEGKDDDQPWSGIVKETEAGTYMIGLENGDAMDAKGPSSLVVAATLTVTPGEGAEPTKPVEPTKPPEPDKPEGALKSMRIAGTWKHNDNDNTGTLDFTIKPGGKLTGKLTIDKKDLRGDLTGTFNYGDDKKVRITFQIEGSYSGKMTLTLNEDGHLLGTMNFYDENDKKVGSAEVDLQIKETIRE